MRSVRLLVRQQLPQLAPLLLIALLSAVLVCAAVLLPRTVAVVADARFDEALGAAAPVTPDVVISGEPGTAEFARLLAGVITRTLDDVAGASEPPLSGALDDPGWLLALEPIEAVSPGAAPDEQTSLTLVVPSGAGWYDTVEAGSAPAPWDGTGPLEIAVDTVVAERLAVEVGDVLAASTGDIRVSALVHADGDDGGGGPGSRVPPLAHAIEERLVSGVTVLTAAAWVDPGSLEGLSDYLSQARLTGWFAVTAKGMDAADAPDLARAVRAATARGARLPSGTPLNVTSRLPTVLAELSADGESTAALVALIAAAPLGASAATLLLAMDAYAARRRPARVLLTARGASRARRALDGVRETAVVVVPGAVIGVLVAWAAVPGPLPPLGAPLLIVLAAVGYGSALALVAPSSRGIHPALRILAELAAVAAAALAVALLAQRGLATTATGVDPLLAAAPLLAGLAASVLLLRVLPVLFRLVEAALQRGHGAIGMIGAARVVRRPTLGLAAVLVVVVAVCATVVSVVIGLTVSAALGAAAERAVGADIRIDHTGGDGADADAVAGERGVAAAVDIDEVAGIAVTDGGRLRGATVYVADTAALHAVRPDLPVLGAAEVFVSADLASSTEGSVELSGLAVQRASVAALGALPGPSGWVLLDSETLSQLPAAAIQPQWTLVRLDAGVPAAPVLDRLDEPGSVISDTGTQGDRLSGRPAVVLVSTVLAVSTAVSLVLAGLAVALAVLAAGPERQRLLAVLRLLGVRRRALPALAAWEVMPVSAVATATGLVLGLALAPLMISAGGVADVLESGSAAVTAPIGMLSLAAAGFIAATGIVGAAAELIQARRRRDSTLTTGAR